MILWKTVGTEERPELGDLSQEASAFIQGKSEGLIGKPDWMCSARDWLERHFRIEGTEGLSGHLGMEAGVGDRGIKDGFRNRGEG